MMTETAVTVENSGPNNNAPKTGSGGRLEFHLEYFKTVPGILKLAELILGILCLALASPAFYSATRYFLFAASVGFISTVVWSFIYLLGVREALSLPIDWTLSELLSTAVITLFYTVAFIVQIVSWINPPLYLSSYQGANIAAGVFGILITLAYGFGTMLLYKEWKSSRAN